MLPLRIYIDPGHGEGVTGEYDPGAVGPTGLTENAVTFDVAKRLGHLLREKGFQTLGVTLEATRDTENLNEAIRAANKEYVNLFVSLHCNAAANPKARGVEVWHRGDNTSQRYAETVLSRIIAQCKSGNGRWLNGHALPLVSRGVKQGTFAVLRKTRMPAILVELAFITNPQEEMWLKEPAVRQQMAQAIADGIRDVVRMGRA